jgi:hypothetical protein
MFQVRLAKMDLFRLPDPEDGGTMILQMLVTVYQSAWYNISKDMNFHD